MIVTPSFDRDIENVAIFIEDNFGENARYDFINGFEKLCFAIAESAHLGLRERNTSLPGLVFRAHWIFLEYNQQGVQFLHVVDPPGTLSSPQLATVTY